MKYRQEIDGLRAIAVVPVIFFHAGYTTFSGGFVGVDIFFVISGYLITSIIFEEKDKKEFSIASFYERRARRILPALSFVLAVTSIFSYVMLPSAMLKEFSQSLISVTLFSSNIYFFITNGYFSPLSEETPLLHTWSLAVEEQYYLLFPIMLMILWSFGKKWVMVCIAILLGASLAFSESLLQSGNINASFYLLPSRGWELLVGSQLAIFSKRFYTDKIYIKENLGIIGALLICYSVFFFDKKTPFPGLYALFPVIGSGLIIIYADSKTYVGKLLSNRHLKLVGLISYSLYLWHQPIFAFLRLKTVGEPSEYTFHGAILVTFGVSFLTWKYIEKPFRNKMLIYRSMIFKITISSILFFLLIGVAGHMFDGFPDRYNINTFADTIKHSPLRGKCHTRGLEYLSPTDSCNYFTDNISWAVFGDSHIVELAYSLATRLKSAGIGLTHLSFSACAPSLLYKVNTPGCTSWINDSVKYLENNDKIQHVVIGFRYSEFLFGGQLDAYPNIPDIKPNYKFVDIDIKQEKKDAREIYWKSLEKIINRLIATGKKVYVLYPIPELPVDIKKAVTPFTIFSTNPMINLKHSSPAEYYYKRNEYIINKLDSLNYGKNIHAIRPFNALCDINYCAAIKNNKALYFDDHHVSLYGAKLIVDSIEIEDSITNKVKILDFEHF